MTAAWFTPPTVKVAVGQRGLAARISIHQGVTVLVTGGVVTEVQYPTQDEVNAADKAYVGGHNYLLTAADAAVLAAAGYGDHLTPTDTYQATYETSYGAP